jgi:hypothetical protein
MIIKFLPHQLQRGIASEGARVIVNVAIEQIKSRDAKAMLGFGIDSIAVLSRASRHVDDAKIPN